MERFGDIRGYAVWVAGWFQVVVGRGMVPWFQMVLDGSRWFGLLLGIPPSAYFCFFFCTAVDFRL